MKTKGFSFIELIVVIAIIMIMTMLLFAVSIQDRTKQDLETAMRQTAVGLRQAQNNALTGHKQGDRRPCRFIFVSDGNGYRVDYDYYNPIDPSDTPDVNGDGVIDCNDYKRATAMTEVTFENNVTLSALPLGGLPGDEIAEITFEVPYGQIYVDGAQATETTDVLLTKNEAVYHVCLAVSGQVIEMGQDTCE